MATPLVTVVVPSFNQGQYLDQALRSIFDQNTPVEVFVQDGGSTDNTAQVIAAWSEKLAGWRSGPDGGQAEAINTGITLGRAEYVCWINSDDYFLPNGLDALLSELRAHPEAPAAYGRTLDVETSRGIERETWVEPFSRRRLAKRCIISQPGTLMRRHVWETVGGLDQSLHMALDYDLWWRIFLQFGPLRFVDSRVAVNRVHDQTKTNLNRRRHYQEAMDVVRRHNGSVPLKWWIAQPYQIWFRSGFREL